jgi:uronate dehydrogenase
MANILITGATGTIGTELTKHLSGQHQLTLVDIDFSDFPEELTEGAKVIETDLVLPENWEGILDGIEYVIQLAGEPDAEAAFYGDLLEMNYKLPHNLYEAATQAADLKRIIFASSIHAVDAYPDYVQVKATDPVRPADLYGVSKVYLEGLASYHASIHGIESIGIRIADYKASDEELAENADEHGLAMYFSSRDMNHLVDCCLEAELKTPYLIVNGISKNTFPRLSYEEAQVELGYQPQDNAFEKRHYGSQA